MPFFPLSFTRTNKSSFSTSSSEAKSTQRKPGPIEPAGTRPRTRVISSPKALGASLHSRRSANNKENAPPLPALALLSARNELRLPQAKPQHVPYAKPSALGIGRGVGRGLGAQGGKAGPTRPVLSLTSVASVHANTVTFPSAPLSAPPAPRTAVRYIPSAASPLNNRRRRHSISISPPAREDCPLVKRAKISSSPADATVDDAVEDAAVSVEHDHRKEMQQQSALLAYKVRERPGEVPPTFSSQPLPCPPVTPEMQRALASLVFHRQNVGRPISHRRPSQYSPNSATRNPQSNPTGNSIDVPQTPYATPGPKSWPRRKSPLRWEYTPLPFSEEDDEADDAGMQIEMQDLGCDYGGWVDIDLDLL